MTRNGLSANPRSRFPHASAQGVSLPPPRPNAPPARPAPSYRRITQDEYDKKARELKERQTEIAMRIEQHQRGKGDFRTTLEGLISLASRAAELFERSKPEQKRQLLAFVFSNLQLRGKKLEFSMRSPFDLMVNRASYSSWLGIPKSNLQANHRPTLENWQI
jgi:hypothetical protein